MYKAVVKSAMALCAAHAPVDSIICYVEVTACQSSPGPPAALQQTYMRVLCASCHSKRGMQKLAGTSCAPYAPVVGHINGPARSPNLAMAGTRPSACGAAAGAARGAAAAAHDIVPGGELRLVGGRRGAPLLRKLPV